GGTDTVVVVEPINPTTTVTSYGSVSDDDTSSAGSASELLSSTARYWNSTVQSRSDSRSSDSSILQSTSLVGFYAEASSTSDSVIVPLTSQVSSMESFAFCRRDDNNGCVSDFPGQSLTISLSEDATASSDEYVTVSSLLSESNYQLTSTKTYSPSDSSMGLATSWSLDTELIVSSSINYPTSINNDGPMSLDDPENSMSAAYSSSLFSFVVSRATETESTASNTDSRSSSTYSSPLVVSPSSSSSSLVDDSTSGLQSDHESEATIAYSESTTSSPYNTVSTSSDTSAIFTTLSATLSSRLMSETGFVSFYPDIPTPSVETLQVVDTPNTFESGEKVPSPTNPSPSSPSSLTLSEYTSQSSTKSSIPSSAPFLWSVETNYLSQSEVVFLRTTIPAPSLPTEASSTSESFAMSRSIATSSAGYNPSATWSEALTISGSTLSEAATVSFSSNELTNPSGNTVTSSMARSDLSRTTLSQHISTSSMSYSVAISTYTDSGSILECSKWLFIFFSLISFII
ncbi:hypothetical protein K6H09_005712, partial [Candida tropicalis]